MIVVTQLFLALFLIGIGMSVAGTGTHLYQQLANKVAQFRIEGESPFENLMTIVVLALCGPYLMLRLGCQPDPAGRLSTINIMLAGVIGFAWSFVTGLMLVGTYLSVRQAVA